MCTEKIKKFYMKNIFAGKIAFITGAGGGIGSAVARLLDELGASCVLCDLQEESLEKVSASLGNPSLCLAFDVSQKDQVTKAVQKAAHHFHKIDIAVNCAGIIFPAPFAELTWEKIDKQLQVNLAGTIAVNKALVDIFLRQGEGSLLNISSLAGIVPETDSSLYTATKFALRGFSQTLHIELKPHNIFVGTVFPDSVDTPMLRYEAAAGGSVLTFLSTPTTAQEVARAVVKALTKKRLETYVPSFSAVFPKILQVWPRLIPPIWNLLEKIGKQKKKRFQQKHGIQDVSSEKKQEKK